MYSKKTQVKAENITSVKSFNKLDDYGMLVKFRLNLTVVFSSAMAYLIAAQGVVNWTELGILALGGFLVTGAANTLNQVLEKDYDRLMKRTKNRPIAAGRMSVSEAVMAAGMMSLFGITLLAFFNPWTALFGMIALICYAFVYTPMKRVSPIAVTIGAVAGALPMLIGCVAFQGELTWLALHLFAVQFFWQFPHFWAIGWLGYEDYTKAGFKLLPFGSEKPDEKAGWLSFWYALALVPLAFVPYLLSVSGLLSGILGAILALVYAWFAWQFYRKNDRKSALNMMFSSFAYLPIVLFLFLFL